MWKFVEFHTTQTKLPNRNHQINTTYICKKTSDHHEKTTAKFSKVLGISKNYNKKHSPVAWPSLVAASAAAATGVAGRAGKWIPRVHRTAAAGPLHGHVGRRPPEGLPA